MTYLPNRQPEGTPAGGQFAARHRAEGSALLSDARSTAAAIGALIRFTAATVKDRALQRRPSRVKPFAQRARLAVMALVLTASAASLTACGTTNSDCKPAASGTSMTQATAVTASYTTEVPAKGGGGHGGGGHGGSGHASEGGHTSAGGTAHESTGGTGGTSGGFRWPWTPHSSGGQQCTTDTPSFKG